MKQMLLCVCLLTSLTTSYSMDNNPQSPVNRRMQGMECTGCYFVASVPACYRCVTKRNNSNPAPTTPQARAEKLATVSVKNDLASSQEIIRCP